VERLAAFGLAAVKFLGHVLAWLARLRGVN
jgi:hypothetical protein